MPKVSLQQTHTSCAKKNRVQPASKQTLLDHLAFEKWNNNYAHKKVNVGEFGNVGMDLCTHIIML